MSSNSCLIGYNNYLPTIDMEVIYMCMCVDTCIHMHADSLTWVLFFYSLPGTTMFFLLMLSCFLRWEQTMWTIHLKTQVTVSSFLSCLPLWVYKTIALCSESSCPHLQTQAACEEVCGGLGGLYSGHCRVNEFEAHFSTAVSNFCWLDFQYWRAYRYHLSSYFLFYLSPV